MATEPLQCSRFLFHPPPYAVHAWHGAPRPRCHTIDDHDGRAPECETEHETDPFPLHDSVARLALQATGYCCLALEEAGSRALITGCGPRLLSYCYYYTNVIHAEDGHHLFHMSVIVVKRHGWGSGFSHRREEEGIQSMAYWGRDNHGMEMEGRLSHAIPLQNMGP